MKIAILFHRLGPYHHARVRAAAGVAEVLAVEASARDSVYAWDLVPRGDTFRHITLFEALDDARPGSAAVRGRIDAVLGNERLDVVALPGWHEGWVLAALAWCVNHGVPAVVMSETTAFDAPRRWYKEIIKRRLVALFSAGLVGGGPHRDYLVTLGMDPSRVFTGYDAVDNAYFETQAAEVRASADLWRAKLGLPPRYFLASNRFVEKKNLSTLLESYACYREETGDAAWPLVLLGDGPLRASLEAQRQALRLESFVTMPGFKQYDELPVYYALAAGFVHASTTEQWGLVVNEAMASGLPVLVSNRCGCAQDLVTEGVQGWTFDPFDQAALTETLKRLTALSAEARADMGRAARERVAAWSPAAFAEGLRRAAESAQSVPPPKFGFAQQLLLGGMSRQ